jgi:hypothetical protein
VCVCVCGESASVELADWLSIDVVVTLSNVLPTLNGLGHLDG